MKNKTTVLVVEDCEPTVLLLRKVFEQSGLRVVQADGAVEALEAARLERPDLILMDVNLTVGNGLEVVRVLRNDPATASIPVIAISGMDPDELREQAMAKGCSDYIPKPFKLYDLAWRVQKWLPACAGA